MILIILQNLIFTNEQLTSKVQQRLKTVESMAVSARCVMRCVCVDCRCEVLGTGTQVLAEPVLFTSDRLPSPHQCTFNCEPRVLSVEGLPATVPFFLLRVRHVHLKAFFSYVWVFGLHLCLCTVCLPGSCRDWKAVSDSLERELQALAGCHVGAATQIQVLWKSSQGS